MVSASELRKGDVIELDGQVYRVIEFCHLKLGRGSAQVRLKLKNMATGQVIERVFQSTYNFSLPMIEQRPARFLFREGELCYFMDDQSYEQIILDGEKISHLLPFLKEGVEVKICFYNGQSIGIELPTTVELRVKDTAPSFKGDTASSGTKPAMLETGYVVQVPFFIQPGDVIRVDTRTGEYVERV